MQSETGDPANDGHQVLQENFTVEENLVFETEEDDLEWNLDKEICKIIEIGCALGCDFSGKENFIGEELMRREKEDERRFRESNEWRFSAESVCVVCVFGGCFSFNDSVILECKRCG